MSGRHRAPARRINVLTTAAVLIGANLAAAIGIAAAARADAPACDQSDVTQCRWTVDVDGRTFDVSGCANEDGNTDGRPCLWFDPDTGRAFYVDSSNYR